MLTSSANQYLRPEYLTPLPTTLDAKKSPLALLAQTCSQIGVDPPTGKSLLQPQDKSSKSSKSSSADQSSREKSSPSTYNNNNNNTSSSSESTKSSSFKPYESCVTRDKAASPEQQQRVPSAHSTSGGNSRARTPGNKRCSSNQSASSGGRAMTPQGRKSTTPGNDGTRESPGSRMPAGSELPSPRSASSNNSPSLQASKPAYSPAQAALASQDLSLGSYRHSPMSLASSTSATAGATTTTTPSAAYGLPFPPQLPPMDAMTASSLMSQHHAAAALKNGLAAHPYLSYARMKMPSGADTLVPVCRDPYCTGCQLNSHLLAATSQASGVNGAKLPPTSQASGGGCPAGCAQCDHKPGSQAAAAAAAAAAASSPYAAYAHAQLVALAAASQLPYMCNWIASDAAYCGKRFASSDELLQHFRTHTAGHQGVATSEASAASAAATTAAALSLLSPPGLGPGHPLLSRTYPTPPLSPLAAGRYHPYGKPYGAPPSLSSLGLPLAPPPHPASGLPPYFSPYSLYAGSRLGAASGMHP